MKTCKKLLAITIALVLLVSTLVSGLVVSAADATTTLAIGTTTIKEGTTTADVEFVLTFAAPTKTPHSLCTITAADGLTLTAIEVDQAKTKYVKQGEDGQWVDDELITDEEAKVTIDNDGKNLAAGKVLVESAADSKAPTVTFITFVATFAVAEGLAEGTYAVSAEADATNWAEDDIAVTVKPGAVVVEAAAPECDHADAETVVSVMPTYNTPGKLTKTCACGFTETTDFYNYANGIKDNKNSFDPTLFRSYYQARIEKTLFQDLVAKGATIDCFGIMFTTDGSIPAADNEAIQKTATPYEAPANKGASGSYTGMNLTQMGWTLSFRGYVKFTLNGFEAYYYGPTYSTVYIETLRANAAEGIINDTIALYDGLASAPDLVSNTWTGTTIQNGTNANITTNKKTFTLNTFQAYYQAKIATAAFNSVSALGTITKYGIMFTTDGSVPAADNENIQKTATTFVSAGNKGSSGSYTGMNFTQMGWDLSFRAYIEYVDANGETQYSYGNTEVVKYIDLVASAKDTNTYASALYDFYNAYLATAE